MNRRLRKLRDWIRWEFGRPIEVTTAIRLITLERFLSRLAKDVMGTNAAPYDMRLTRANLGTVAEGGTAVWCPRHLPHALLALDSLYPKPRIKPALAETGHKQAHCVQRRSLLPRTQMLELSLEPREPLVGRHRYGSGLRSASSAARNSSSLW
jgi:hypothetical protein